MATFQDRIWELFEQEKDKDHKCTREKFAEKCGVSKGQMDGYLKGNGQYFCDILETIATNNKVSIGWLTGVSDNRLGESMPFKDIVERLPDCDFETLQEFASYLNNKYKE